MKIVLSGGEKGSHRRVLVENHVPNIAFNITPFPVPKRKEIDLKEMLGGAEIYVYTSDDDEDLSKYDEFVRLHSDSLACVIGRPDYNGAWLGDKYVPLWNDPKDLERLAYLCEKVGRVAISDRAINAETIRRIKQLKQRWGVTLVGLTSKTDNIEAIDWDVVIVSSWTSVIRFGETQVWDGHGLRRYPAQKKESARKKHRPDIMRMGLDFDAILADEVDEVAKLAVKSWMAWGDKTFGTDSSAAYQVFGGEGGDDEELLSNDEIATISPEMALSPNPVSRGTDVATTRVQTRPVSERKLLPVLGLESILDNTVHRDEEGNEITEIESHREDVVTYVSGGIRQCDSCYLAPKCPEFKEHADCAYDLPIEVKTKAQLRAVMNAMITMQAGRVFFAKLGEDMEGTGMDPALSSEMDRFFRLVNAAKDIEDTRDMFKINVEARSSSGVISRIFGAKAAEKVHAVETPMSTKELDEAIIDAHVLD